MKGTKGIRASEEFSDDDFADAYNSGIEAAHDGKSAAICPDEYDSPLGQEWLRGYYDGGGED